eukprot:TRINITY_DN195_c0_g1_i10.p6 TRINITY_DN195_c0_g1~~TRINITY_DN195_c0_g1_i10.p6  ORF type:complete len:100 (+),score=7.53 TRINITY_DN195_c0_g1_i10:421-720(+)
MPEWEPVMCLKYSSRLANLDVLKRSESLRVSNKTSQWPPSATLRISHQLPFTPPRPRPPCRKELSTSDALCGGPPMNHHARFQSLRRRKHIHRVKKPMK